MLAAQLVDPPPTPDPPFLGHRTARRAVELLIEADPRYRCPSRVERAALLVGFAKVGKTLNGAAFDAVRLEAPVDLASADAIAGSVPDITICEIKSTSQKSIGPDLKGYFFNITAAELLTAQSLGDRYRFVFVNIKSGEHQELTLPQIFARSRGVYPAWHIRF